MRERRRQAQSGVRSAPHPDDAEDGQTQHDRHRSDLSTSSRSACGVRAPHDKNGLLYPEKVRLRQDGAADLLEPGVSIHDGHDRLFASLQIGSGFHCHQVEAIGRDGRIFRDVKNSFTYPLRPVGRGKRRHAPDAEQYFAVDFDWRGDDVRLRRSRGVLGSRRSRNQYQGKHEETGEQVNSHWTRPPKTGASLHHGPRIRGARCNDIAHPGDRKRTVYRALGPRLAGRSAQRIRAPAPYREADASNGVSTWIRSVRLAEWGASDDGCCAAWPGRQRRR